MSRYLIKPSDVLFFRDGRESQAGSEYSASGLFPPSPITFYGALRSSILAKEGERFHYGVINENFKIENAETLSIVGSKIETGSLRIVQFSLCKYNDEHAIEPIYPVPNDLLKNKDDTISDSLTIYKPIDLGRYGIRSNAPINNLQSPWSLHKEGEFYEPLEGYLSTANLTKYLTGKADNIEPIDNIVITEPRMHVAIDPGTLTAAEAKLFTIPFARMKAGHGFSVGIDGDQDQLGSEGLLRLGGEGRSAAFRKVESGIDSAKHIKSALLQCKDVQYMKLYLSTPAIFENGWIPDGIGRDGKGEVNGVPVELIGASLGRYQTVGGWDLAYLRPKTAYRAVPAGSVYYFKVEDEVQTDFITNTCGKSICQNEDFQKQGLAITLTGVI